VTIAGRHTASRAFSPLEYRDPAPAPWLIHVLGVLNRFVIMRGLVHVTRFDLPAADAQRLRGAVNRDTAAFLGPNHPEFLTDWLVDKELSRRVSPLMAHWAAHDIVNASPLARAFWLSNNLIANVPGGGGKEYSVSWALRGHGVLLHPEGTATWQGERVASLLPGLVDMAWDAAVRTRAAGAERKVWLVPIAWRFAFRGDASDGLTSDMARIERGLSLPRGDRLVLPERFAALMRHLLARQCGRLGLAAPGEREDYFAAQARAVGELVRSLVDRYGELDPDLTRAQFQLRRAMRERAASDPDGVRKDRARLGELQRLSGFDPALYDRALLEQERIAEVLKRTRSSLLTRGFANALHNTVPIAAGPRNVHVRVAEPIAVRVDAAGTDVARAKAALLAEHRARLQAMLDQIGVELAASDPSRRLPNLLHRG
jgi:hypothetical protein